MSDGPERIWANVSNYTNGRWVDFNSTIRDPKPDCIEGYVRADLHEQLKAENAELKRQTNCQYSHLIADCAACGWIPSQEVLEDRLYLREQTDSDAEWNETELRRTVAFVAVLLEGQETAYHKYTPAQFRRSLRTHWISERESMDHLMQKNIELKRKLASYRTALYWMSR